jgi:hypothetical protein
MAKIQFFEGYSWDNIRPTQVIRMIPIAETIERLKNIREDWEQATDGKLLREIPVSLGIMLSDFCDLLMLDQRERVMVLGEELYRDLEGEMKTVFQDKNLNTVTQL